MKCETVIGIGPARSGTRSLAYLLREWGLDVGHESTVSVPWAMDKPIRYERAKRDLNRSDGDVACWLTQAARKLMDDFSDLRCIALHRDRGDVVESCVQKFGELRIRASKPFGPMCFPTYEDGTLEEAWGWYWDDCMKVIEALHHEQPGRVLSVETEALENEDTQQEIADFLAIKDWHHVTKCHITS